MTTHLQAQAEVKSRLLQGENGDKSTTGIERQQRGERGMRIVRETSQQ